MNLALIVYLIGLADNLKSFLGVGIGLIAAMSFFILIFFPIILIEMGLTFKEFLIEFRVKTVFIVVFIASLVATTLPSKETSYAMLAAYGVDVVISNDKVQSIAGKSLDVLEKQLDNYLSSQNLESENPVKSEEK